MKERAVLFSGPMVRAILEGRKTQTRRVAKLPLLTAYSSPTLTAMPEGDFLLERWEKCEREMNNFGRCDRVSCPYGVPGDRLWVRETWMRYEPYPTIGDDGRKLSLPDSERVMAELELREYWLKRVVYGADAEGTDYLSLKPGRFDEVWRPSIHMPRWASRLTLEIVKVRVERLQDVSEKDCVAEGVQLLDTNCDGECGATPCQITRSPYINLWDSINGKTHPWASNPWVWVIEFNKLP